MNSDHQKEAHHGRLRSTTSLSQAIKKMDQEKSNTLDSRVLESKALEVNGTAAFGFTFDDPVSNEANEDPLPSYMQNEYAQMLAQGIISVPTQSPNEMFPTSHDHQSHTLRSPNTRNQSLTGGNPWETRQPTLSQERRQEPTFLSKYGGLQNQIQYQTQHVSRQNLDISDLRSPVSYVGSQKSALSQRQCEYQLSQYRMLEMQSNLLYSTKDGATSIGKGGPAMIHANRTQELHNRNLITPDYAAGPSEVVRTRKREVNLPRRRSPVIEEPDPKDLKTAERGEMREVFDEWLTYMRRQKQKWAQLVRFRFLLSRMKQNRIVLQWKAQVRKRKVQRLRYTIISHQHYKYVLRQCIHEWQQVAERQRQLKQGLLLVQDVLDRRAVQSTMIEIKNEARRTVSLRHLSKIVTRNNLDRVKSSSLEQLRLYSRRKQLAKVKQERADELRRSLLLLTHFRQLEKFRHMKVKKLDNIRKVNDHLHEKRRKRAVDGLRCNLQQIRAKEQNLRVACQFSLFRHPYFIVKQAFRALQEAPLRRKEHAAKVKTFRLQTTFRHVRAAAKAHRKERKEIAVDAVEEQAITMKLYSSYQSQEGDLLNSSKDNQAVAITVFQRVQDEVRKSRDLAKEEEHKKMTRCLNNFAPKIDQLRCTLLQKSLQRVFSRTLTFAFTKLRTGPALLQMHSAACDHFETSLKRRATSALKQYRERKAQDMVKSALARKFNYMRRISFMLKVLQRNLALAKKKQEKAWRAAILHKQHTLQRGFTAFRFLEAIGQHKERRLHGLLQKKAAQTMRLVFQELARHREARQDRRIQAAMAQLKYEKGLLLRHLRLLKQTTAELGVKNWKKANMAARAERHFRKRITGQVVRELVRHARKSGQDRAKVTQVKGGVAKRLMVETFMLWKIAHLEGTTKRIGKETAENHYRSLLLAKAVSALQDHAQRRHRALLKEDFAVRHHNAVLRQKALSAWQQYLSARREKKELYARAMRDRQRLQLQAVCFKLLLVGRYWAKRSPQRAEAMSGCSFVDLQLRAAFAKWKNQVQSTSQLPCREPSGRRPLQPSVQQAQSETLDWLYSFDKPREPASSAKLTPAKSVTHEQFSSQKKPLEAKDSLRQFDDFLATMQTAKKPTDFVDQAPEHSAEKESQDWHRRPATTTDNTGIPQARQPVSPPQKRLSALPEQVTGSEVAERSTYLKKEVKQFLQDKQLLRQLEQTQNTRAVELLRSQIVAKSSQVQLMCAELNQLKTMSGQQEPRDAAGASVSMSMDLQREAQPRHPVMHSSELEAGQDLT